MAAKAEQGLSLAATLPVAVSEGNVCKPLAMVVAAAGGECCDQNQTSDKGAIQMHRQPPAIGQV